MYLQFHIQVMMKTVIRNALQRAGGCCEPVPILTILSPSELAAERYSRHARVTRYRFKAVTYAAKEGGTTLIHVPHNKTNLSSL
jgi:hypothetical protein